jgi:hypothetical protein
MDESAKIKEPDGLSLVCEAHPIHERNLGGLLQSIEFRIVRGEIGGIRCGALEAVSQKGRRAPPHGLDLA